MARIVTDEALQDYIGKKAHKMALQVARKLTIGTVIGYNNDSNPFGDANLTENFVWRKKIEKDLTNGLDPRKLSCISQTKRQLKRIGEIEKVKKRREERVIEKAQHEEATAVLTRERARAEFQGWEKKDEAFQFEQSKVRSEIRLRGGRAKPIDVLSKNLNLSDDFYIEIQEPYEIYKGLSVKEMEELRIDIKMHLELDRATPTHVEFWEAMMVLCDWEIAEARKGDVLDRGRVRREEPQPELVSEDRGLHASVDAEVTTVLQGKSFCELDEMQTQIEAQMRSGKAKVVEYWEVVLKRLYISKARARLREIHADLLRKHLPRLDDSDERDSRTSQGEEPEDPAGRDSEEPGADIPGIFLRDTHTGDTAKEAEDEPGSISPELVQDYDDGDEVVDPETDKANLERKRAEVLEKQQRRLQDAAAVGPNVPDVDNLELTGPERAIALKAMGGMEAGDSILGIGSEVNLESQVYWWHDKYRPRKPKYFIRVHTGYEWNKYNQTHYDHDNPPPKIVQGYKFNIFYPDLVDKTKAPTSHFERDGSTGRDTCLIRFHAGPPYEDIAFRIIANGEWEYSHKKGFKCAFERGIVHLFFNFKRCRYRR